MIRGAFVLVILILATLVLAPTTAVLALAAPRSRAPWAVIRLWSRVILLAAGVRVVTDGGEALSSLACGSVIVANHSSNFDIYALQEALPVRFHWIAKASLFRIPLLGRAMRAGGFVPLERQDHERAVQSLNHAASILRAGSAVVFFPEGTRSSDGRLRKFKKGAFVTALDAGVPVVPVAIHGAHHVQARRSLRVRTGTIRVVIGEPLPTEGLTRDDRHDLLARSRDRLVELLPPEHRPAGD